MGCTNSRMNSEVVPEKIRPFLFRRYEEIKRRRQGSPATMQKEPTLSKKKLLLKEDEEIDSNSSHEAEAELKPEEVTSPRKVEPINKVAPLPESDTKDEAITDAENNDDNTKPMLQEKEKEKEKEKDDTQKTEETVSKNEDEQEDDTDDDDDDDDADDLGDRLVCPGSPSFKIYCTPPQNDKEESKSQEEMDTHQKSTSVESMQDPGSGHVKAPSADSTNSASSSHNSKSLNEVAETQTASKRRKNMKNTFRAVKNIMVVKSLYASCSCAGIDRTRLVAAKTTKSH